MRWDRIGTALRASRGRKWAVRYLVFLVLLALFSSFLANDRPILVSYADEIRFPVLRSLGEIFTGPRPYGDLPQRSWRKAETDWAIWPPIPYSAEELDLKNSYVAPFGPQKTTQWSARHWLGTDQNGRDTLAGLIRGSRIAILVGLVAMSIALIIGLLLGSFAGYFANDGLRRSRHQLWAMMLGVGGAVIYFLAILIPATSTWGWFLQLLLGLATGLFLIIILRWTFGLISKGWPWFRKSVYVPLDAMIMRLIELFNAFPTLVLLIAILPIIDRPTILTVMLIIGLIRWTGIARFVRSELLRIRRLPYIDAARLSGFSDLRILFRHALPNALGPVVIAVSFGMAGAILLEAYLSFLSIGLSPDQISWGSLLRQSRDQPAAWWLAIFPGLAIFFTVLSLNVVGEALRK
jgi:peptide/nickel transport system permease protein